MEDIRKAFETIASQIPIDDSKDIINELSIALRNRLVNELEKVSAQIRDVELERERLEVRIKNLLSQQEFMERICQSDAYKSNQLNR